MKSPAFFKHLRRKLASHWLWGMLSVCLAIFIVGGGILFTLFLALPSTEALNRVEYSVPLRIYSANNELMAQYGNERRMPVTFNEVPSPLVHAVLATEDQRFFDHPGVDPIGIIRAGVAVISSGKKVQGASTITMQVARNFFLSRRKTYSRKLEEMLLALKIDQEFSKQKILELYLNKIYFGSRAYGVAAAAEVYYGKKLSELTLPEMAMIAGLPQAPSRDNPINNPVAAKERRNHVLERMLANHFIDQQTYDSAKVAPVTASYHHKVIAIKAPYASEYIRQAIVKRFGKTMAYHGGLIIHTTIYVDAQTQAQQSLKSGLIAYSMRHGWRGPISQSPGNHDPADIEKQLTDQNKHIFTPLQAAWVTQVNTQSVQAMMSDGQTITIPWTGLSWARRYISATRRGSAPKQASDLLKPGDVIEVQQTNARWQMSQTPQTEGAIISMRPNDGAILAMVGGYDFKQSKFNRAIQAERQPGSCFKPFIYSAALAQGNTLATIINDAPVVIKDTGENQLWRPQNDNFRFNGPTRMRLGLVHSRNLVSVRLLQKIGIPYALDYVKRFGFNPDKLPHSLSLALGTGLATPYQLAQGYLVFANGGYRPTPYVIQQINTEDGRTLYTHPALTACTQCINNSKSPTTTQIAPQAVSWQNAFLMDQALRDVIESGTGRAARILKRSDIAGKTGTTNDQADAWFSGFNPNLLTVVWVGFDDPTKTLHEYGSQAALPIWINYMRQRLKNTPEQFLPEPNHIISVRINPATGQAAPTGESNAIFEYFRQQYAPGTQNIIDTMPSTNTTPNEKSNDTSKAIDNIF